MLIVQLIPVNRSMLYLNVYFFLRKLYLAKVMFSLAKIGSLLRQKIEKYALVKIVD
jgi:hypothetical protein